MMSEHDTEGERFRHIEKLTNGYSAPEDACNSYQLVLQQLKAFEAALHQQHPFGKQHRFRVPYNWKRNYKSIHDANQNQTSI